MTTVRRFSNRDIQKDNLNLVLGSVAKGEIICISNSTIAAAYSDAEIAELLETADIVHHGLSFGSGIAFESLQVCAFNWFLLNIDHQKTGISWKATFDFVAFHSDLLAAVGDFDEGYLDVRTALMDFCYRTLVFGGKPLHLSLDKEAENDFIPIPLDDESRFAYKHLGVQAGRYFRLSKWLMDWKYAPRPKDIPLALNYARSAYKFKLRNQGEASHINAYSAIIPTINRYNYITKSIDSLLSLPFPPSEIIVIDQTCLEQRQEELYEPYILSGLLRVIYLDQAGQCTARNTGLAAANNDWVLLFEDDAEAWPDMVEEHLALIRQTNCDVSTGVIVPPGAGADFIIERNRRYAVSDIFTTGNAFLRKSIITEAGGFDPVFDRGPGADDDMGRRLHLQGRLILYNYKSIETHYKAPQGGMRVHGAWWRMTSTTWGPFPPPTQLHVIRKYYPKKYWLFLIINMLIRAKKKYRLPAYVGLLVLFPYKYFKSVAALKKLRSTK